MKTIIVVLLWSFLIDFAGYSQDTMSYISSGCIRSGSKSQEYQNGPPVIIGFKFSNDSLHMYGEIGANCGSSHIAKIEKLPGTIYVSTYDTGMMANCGCVFKFDFFVKALPEDTLVDFNGMLYNINLIGGIIQAQTEPEMSISLFPNPGTGIFSISHSADTHIEEIRITDISGRLVHQSILEGNKLDLSACSPGVYSVRFTIAPGKYFNKIIVKN
jgi:hypothetical protein